MGFYEESIEAFRIILEKDPEYVPALKGISDSLIRQAQGFVAENLDLNAVDNCQEALNFLAKGSKIRPDLSCIWALMGEACTMLHVLPEEDFESFSIPKVFSEGKEKASKSDVLKLGTDCYINAMRINQQEEKESYSKEVLATSWYNLAFSYFVRSIKTDPETKKELISRSFLAIRNAIGLVQENPSHWNLLGVIAFYKDDMPLAQHAFIKSLGIKSDAMSWTNLGIIYQIIG